MIPSILALDYPDLSEQDLISCSTAGDCNGGWESDALIYIKKRGIVSENCFPYKEQDVNCDVCVDWKNKLTKIKLEKNIETFRKKMLETWEELPNEFITSSEKVIGRDDVLSYIDELNKLYYIKK